MEENKYANYMSADEACIIAKRAIENDTYEFLDDIMPEIKTAAQNGEFFIWWNYQIKDNSIKALENLGYMVEDLYNQKDGYSYRISWESIE